MPQKRELHDHFFTKAKADGYAARSAYKLLEIARKRPVIRKGSRVVDLGCAPGSWLQVAAELVGGAGGKGLVVGIDLKPVTIELPANARAVVGDVFKVTAEELLGLTDGAPGASAGGGGKFKRFDTVLSDMAPNTEGGGGGISDHFRSVELCRRVLELCPKMLGKGGSLVMKVFEGEEYPALLKETSRAFKEVKGLKPEASRDVSREMFIIATGYKGEVEPAAAPESPIALAPPAPKPRPGWGGS